MYIDGDIELDTVYRMSLEQKYDPGVELIKLGFPSIGFRDGVKGELVFRVVEDITKFYIGIRYLEGPSNYTGIIYNGEDIVWVLREAGWIVYPFENVSKGDIVSVDTILVVDRPGTHLYDLKIWSVYGEKHVKFTISFLPTRTSIVIGAILGALSGFLGYKAIGRYGLTLSVVGIPITYWVDYRQYKKLVEKRGF